MKVWKCGNNILDESDSSGERLFALAAMPYFETWTTEHSTGMVTLETADAMLARGESVSGKVLGPETETKSHVRIIPRRTRRVMARIKSKREYRSAHGLA